MGQKLIDGKNNIVLNGIALDNNLISMDSIINIQLHNDSRFYYVLRYYIKDIVYEILIFDDGTIKHKDNYYDSPILLSAAQALMPIIYKDKNEMPIDAIDVMLNSNIATYAYYKVSDVNTSNYEQSLSELCDNAVRLRSSAYFIIKNMILTEDIEKNIEDMQIIKSSGYSGGKQVNMYIYIVEDKISYVKLVYNGDEKTYILNSTINQETKLLPLVNIWTAS